MTKRNSLIYIFFLVLAVDILAVLFRENTVRFFSKPLIMVALMIHVWVKNRGMQSVFIKLLMSALFFSWLGDVLLQLETFSESFFLIGLSAFLIAHLFYIVLFNKIFKKEKGMFRFFLIIPALLYYAALILFLLPTLGGMKAPVLVYGLVITTMLIVATHIYSRTNSENGLYIAAGAMLFVISDSILAINKFHTSFMYAGVIIMFTYGLAQYYIVKGVCQYQQKLDRATVNV